jgi:hypothetical protein
LNTTPRSGAARASSLLLTLALLLGWAVGGVQTFRCASLEDQVAELKVSQTKWRMRAGHAYTALLRAEGGDAGVIRLPEGATMDCVDAPGGGKHCDPTTIFPPDN